MAEPTGPSMIVATEALRPPKIRIGKIGGNFTLPRTIPLASLIAGGIGAFIGVLVALVLFGGALSALMYTTLIGAGVGVFSVTYSPLKGESLFKWAGLRIRTGRSSLPLEDGVLSLAVGICVIKSANLGEYRMFPGAVNIPPSAYDERGVPIDPEDLLDNILDSHGAAQSRFLGTDPNATSLSAAEGSPQRHWSMPSRLRPGGRDIQGASPLGTPRPLTPPPTSAPTPAAPAPARPATTPPTAAPERVEVAQPASPAAPAPELPPSFAPPTGPRVQAPATQDFNTASHADLDPAPSPMLTSAGPYSSSSDVSLEELFDETPSSPMPSSWTKVADAESKQDAPPPTADGWRLPGQG